MSINPKILPSQERLHQLFDYDAVTGILLWRVNKARAKMGQIAGSSSNGYWHVNMNGQHYRAHRLIWKWVTGKEPPKQLDHEDCNGKNNSWLNLRSATISQNRANSRTHHKSVSGLKGARWNKKIGQWYSSISKDGTSYYLGAFSTAIDAHQAYLIAARRLFGEFARAA